VNAGWMQDFIFIVQTIHNKLKEYFDNTDPDNGGIEAFGDEAAAISQKSSQEDSLPCSQ
jgi:hypothetical protein